MIEVKDLICVRHEQILCSKVAFLLQPGEALQIIGPNGIGKTTLLRVIAGLLPKYAGKIAVNSNHICYIGHASNLHPALTALQNLKFLQTMQSDSINSNIEQIFTALEYFKIKHCAATKCGELSAGQRQRVSLAPLCFTTAKLWLLDEPLAHLDAASVELLMALCVKHLLTGGMLICATHNLIDLTPVTSATLALNKYV